jgi:hypothetical protein
MGSRRVCSVCHDDFVRDARESRCPDCAQRRTPGVAALDALEKVTDALGRDDDG